MPLPLTENAEFQIALFLRIRCHSAGPSDKKSQNAMFKNVQNTVPPKKAEHRKMLPTWLKR